MTGGGGRNLSVRVKTAKGRKSGSTRWLQRQLNDPYVEEAKRQGYRSRAAFKLIEIADKHQLLKPGMTVLDLGAAPGGWSQIAAQRVGAEQGRGRVIAADISEMEPIAGVEVLHLDVDSEEGAARLREILGGAHADLVLSDMAASATGHKGTDHIRIVALVESALALAAEVLAPGGAFLAKVLQGGGDNELMAALKRDFAKVRHVKPKASRADWPRPMCSRRAFAAARRSPRTRDPHALVWRKPLAWQPKALLVSRRAMPGANGHESRSREGILRQDPQILRGSEDLGMLRRRRRAAASAGSARKRAPGGHGEILRLRHHGSGSAHGQAGSRSRLRLWPRRLSDLSARRPGRRGGRHRHDRRAARHRALACRLAYAALRLRQSQCRVPPGLYREAGRARARAAKLRCRRLQLRHQSFHR